MTLPTTGSEACAAYYATRTCARALDASSGVSSTVPRPAFASARAARVARSFASRASRFSSCRGPEVLSVIVAVLQL